VSLDSSFRYERAWVANQGSACTSAAALIALGLLDVPDLPALDAASLALGAPIAYGAPGLLDYVTLAGRRAPLDVRIERLAEERGAPIRSRTGVVAPWPALRTGSGELLLAHLAWGQERPGVYGTWGFHPLDRATWSTGGHSVVVLQGGRGPWRVLDPNHPGVQVWPRPGVAVTATRLRRLPAA
jgi:hypothetical protein